MRVTGLDWTGLDWTGRENETKVWAPNKHTTHRQLGPKGEVFLRRRRAQKFAANGHGIPKLVKLPGVFRIQFLFLFPVGGVKLPLKHVHGPGLREEIVVFRAAHHRHVVIVRHFAAKLVVVLKQPQPGVTSVTRT